jgi:hypothetical protein
MNEFEKLIAAIVADYKAGTKPAVLALRIIAIKPHPIQMAFIALEVASYMTDHDECEFRSQFLWTCTEVMNARG